MQGRTYIEYSDVKELSRTVDIMIEPIEAHKIEPDPN